MDEGHCSVEALVGVHMLPLTPRDAAVVLAVGGCEGLSPAVLMLFRENAVAAGSSNGLSMALALSPTEASTAAPADARARRVEPGRRIDAYVHRDDHRVVQRTTSRPHSLGAIASRAGRRVRRTLTAPGLPLTPITPRVIPRWAGSAKSNAR